MFNLYYIAILLAYIFDNDRLIICEILRDKSDAQPFWVRLTTHAHTRAPSSCERNRVAEPTGATSNECFSDCNSTGRCRNKLCYINFCGPGLFIETNCPPHTALPCSSCGI